MLGQALGENSLSPLRSLMPARHSGQWRIVTHGPRCANGFWRSAFDVVGMTVVEILARRIHVPLSGRPNVQNGLVHRCLFQIVAMACTAAFTFLMNPGQRGPIPR